MGYRLELKRSTKLYDNALIRNETELPADRRVTNDAKN